MFKANKISVRAARLIILFLQNKLKPEESDELDNWIGKSDRNMRLFEDLTDKADENVFDAESLIIETEELLDYWMIAGLIVRYKQGIIRKEQQRILDEWRESSEKNRKLFEELQDIANLQQLIAYVHAKLNEANRQKNLN